jgi:hypothetical protein
MSPSGPLLVLTTDRDEWRETVLAKAHVTLALARRAQSRTMRNAVRRLLGIDRRLQPSGLDGFENFTMRLTRHTTAYLQTVHGMGSVRHQAIVSTRGPDWSSTSCIWEICDLHEPIGDSTDMAGSLKLLVRIATLFTEALSEDAVLLDEDVVARAGQAIVADMDDPKRPAIPSSGGPLGIAPDSVAWGGPLSEPFLATRCLERGITRSCIAAEPCRIVEGAGGTRTGSPRAVRLDVHSHVQTSGRLSPVFSPYDPRADAMEVLRSRRSLNDFLRTSDTAMAA